ncbi:MAG: MtrB/PioB family decaheme-associated outer membrane protein [Nitrospinae bacterium]|nr:MtrB/PioB family decaheme-associated outer membrane protein [Nitrospinota bacterium]
MINKMSLLAILTVLSLAISAHAGDLTGHLTAGGEYTNLDNNSFKSGEYNGIYSNGLNVIGNADLHYSKGNFYTDVIGRNLGIDNRDVDLSLGIYGGYGMKLSYSETPHLISNTATTLYTNAGSDNLLLPTGFVAGSTTTAMAAVLNANKRDYDLRVDRKNLSAALRMPLKVGDFELLTLDLKYDRDTRKGTKDIAGTLGVNGGTTSAVILPEPVDYQTNDFTVGLSFASECFYAKAEYFNSQFLNRYESLTWESPLTSYNTNNATYPTVARTSLPPDNGYQRYSLTGGINLPYSTRITFVGERGIMEQDQTLLPYSINPLSTITTPLPRNSSQAKLETSHIVTTFTTRPVDEFSFTAKYRFYETVNKTPKSLFQYVKNDLPTTQAALTDDFALYNLPIDYIQNKVDLEAAYSFFKGNILKFGYAFDQISRDYREYGETRENIWKAGLNSQIAPELKANVNYSFGQRKGVGDYKESNIYYNYHTTDYINTVGTTIRFDNNPSLRRFDLANRDKNKIAANLHFSPVQTATLGLYYSYDNDNYKNSPLGLKEKKMQSLTADINVLLKENLNVFGYYTLDDTKALQSDRYFQGFAIATQAFDSTRDWSIDTTEKVHTFGVGVDYTFYEDLINIDANYSYSRSSINYDFTTGSSLSAALPVPKDRTSLHSLDFTTRYKYTEKFTFGLGYAYEQYSSYNWSNANVNPASTDITQVITLIGPSRGYKANKALFFITYNIN